MNQDAGLSDKSGGRRNFVVAALAVLVGAVVNVVPFAVSVPAFFGPLLGNKKKKEDRENEDRGKHIRVATLDAVPADGVPHRFRVVDTRIDKWNVYPPEPVDAVFLMRISDQEPPRAFTATCPHLGCSVDYKADAREYKCPCHASGFARVDGAREYGPAPRGLDELTVDMRGENKDEVWILFKRYRSGTEEQITI